MHCLGILEIDIIIER